MEERQQHAIEEFVSERTPRPLSAPTLAFDLPREAERLRGEAPWHEHGRNAQTLIKHSEFRLVLIVLAPGARIEPNSVDERTCVQTLRGRLLLQLSGSVLELPAGGLTALDARVPFAIEAAEPSELLLWVGWSRG